MYTTVSPLFLWKSHATFQNGSFQYFRFWGKITKFETRKIVFTRVVECKRTTLVSPLFLWKSLMTFQIGGLNFLNVQFVFIKISTESCSNYEQWRKNEKRVCNGIERKVFQSVLISSSTSRTVFFGQNLSIVG